MLIQLKAIINPINEQEETMKVSEKTPNTYLVYKGDLPDSNQFNLWPGNIE